MLPVLTDKQRWENAVECVRRYTRDDPKINRLLGGQAESSDTEIRMAITIAIEDWNNTPPPLGRVTIKNHPAKHLLLMKAAIEVMKGAMLWHSREHMPSSDGGTSADDHAKAGEYSAWIVSLDNEYERKKGDAKTQQNITAALGRMGAPSEYSYFYMYGEDLMW